MASLVADYSSDSDTDNSCNSTPSVQDVPLPKPNFAVESNDIVKEKSVFINPFVEADKAEKAVLEKHVKMVSVDVKTVNGKKICWNNRRNRCRFGHNCKYAHESDLQLHKSLNKSLESNVKNSFGREETVLNKNKRPGVSEDLISSNKIIKL